MNHCKNCQYPADLNFCSNCGQKTHTLRLNLSEIIRELPKSVFHIDKGILFNLTQLFKRPGPAISDYIEGKRKYFFHPVSYLVLALILNYLVMKVTDMHYFDAQELLTMSPEKAKAIQKYDATQWWFLEHTYLYILLAVPLSTFFLFIIFKIAGQFYNLAESAVVVFFTIAQGVIIQSILYFSFGWVRSGPFIRTIELINTILLVLYASYVLFQLTSTLKIKFLRASLALIAGLGLFASWLASAYILHFLFGE